jgi:O-antigen/teichoic acid export membrane protein
VTDPHATPETAAALAGGPAPSASAAAQMAVMQYVARAVGLLAVVVGASLVTRRLGTDYADWGTVLLAVALAGVLLEPGMTPVVVRRLSIDPGQAPSARALLPLRLGLGLVSLVLVVGVTVATRGADVAWLALFLGGQVVGRSMVNNATPWLQVDQRLHRMAVLEALTAALGLASLAVGLALDAPTPVLGALAFTVPAFVLAVLMRHEFRLTPSSRLPSPGPQSPKVWSVVRETAPLAVAIALAAVYTRTSIAFVNHYEGDARASQFFFAFLFAEQSIVIAGITAGAVLPLLAARTRIAHLISDEVTQRLLVAITTVSTLVCAGLIAGSGLLTQVIGGAELAGAERYIALVAPTAAVIMPAMVVAYVYISIGQARRYLVFATVGLVANLALNLALTPEYGALASARITWGTELIVTILPLAAVVRSNRSGLRAGLVMGVLVAASVLASELAAADVLNRWLAGGLLVAVSLAVAHGPMRWLLREVVRRD